MLAIPATWEAAAGGLQVCDTQVEVREHFAGSSSLLLPGKSQGLDSGHGAWGKRLHRLSGLASPSPKSKTEHTLHLPCVFLEIGLTKHQITSRN